MRESIEFLPAKNNDKPDEIAYAARSRAVSQMRQAKILLLAWATFASSGCDDVVLTHPVIRDGEAIVDDRLLGTWSESDDPESDTFTIRRNGEAYVGVSKEEGETEKIDIGLTRIGGRLFLQATEENCSQHLFFDEQADQTCYLMFQFEIDQEMFRLRPLDHKRLFQDSLAGKLLVSHEIRRQVKVAPGAASDLQGAGPTRKPRVYTCVVLTAPTDELRRFLAAYTTDESILGEAMAWSRRGEPPG